LAFGELLNKLRYIMANLFYFFVLGIAAISGCSVRQLAVNSVADALSDENASVFASDDDPELVGDALPFALKTMESLLEATPRHKKLLVATSSGFVQYAHAYVVRPAEATETTNIAYAREQRKRAKRLFLRARNYGLRALDLDYPSVSDSLLKNRLSLVSKFQKKDVPAMYWTAVAWASAISMAKNDMALVGNFPVVEAMMARALQLDESWSKGTLHEFYIILSAGKSESQGGGAAVAEKHFKRAMELNGGRSISPIVYLAESVCVPQQDRVRFESLLNEVLKFDVNLYPENRLSNILAQRKARLLISNIDNLFFLNDNDNPQENGSIKTDDGD
jgi:hypothetical protein